MKSIKLACLFMLVSLMALPQLFSQNYDSNFFPIGVWSIKGDFRSVDDFLFNVNTAAAYHHESFQNLKAQGFNSVFLSYDPIGYTLDTILDIAEINDMKVISSMQHLSQLIGESNDNTVTSDDIIQAIENDSIARLKQSPAVLGYYLYDEPLPGWIDFDVLQNARNILTNMTADSPHPILSCWNDEQHMEYIDGYLNLDVLMMDTYPFEDGDAEGDISDYMPSYFSSMPDPPSYSDYINSVRENHCSNPQRPFWVVFQAFGDLETPENGGYWRQVFPKEIRLQVNLAVMQGAKGVWYFLYESEYPYLLGMLDVSGQPTLRLTEAIAVNQQLSQITDILLKLQVVQDQSVITTSSGEIKLHEDTATDQKYVIAVNTDVFNVAETTINIDKSAIGYEVHSIIDKNTNESIPFTESSTQVMFTLNIDQADGRLIELSEEQLAIDDLIANNLFISPNPTNDLFQIHHQGIDSVNFIISDIQGKKLKEGLITGDTPIRIGEFSTGVYYLTLQTAFGSKMIKIVKH